MSDPSHAAFRQPASRSLLLVLALALVVRLLAVTAGFSHLQDDPDAYAQLGETWAATGVFGFADASHPEGVRPTAFRPPFYPWLLSWLVRDGQLALWLVAAVHVVLGTLTVALAFAIARHLGVPAAWLPALAVAVDPILLRASQLVMTETLATCLALLGWWLWLRALHRTPGESRWFWGDWVGVGLVFGLSILARPTAAPWVGLSLLGILCLRQLSWSQRWQRLVAVCLPVVALLAVWTVRNQRQLGQPVWATTHGGYTLLLANNPSLYVHFSSRGPTRDWQADAFHTAWLSRYQPGVDLSDLATWPPSESPTPQPSSNADLNTPREFEDNRLAYQAAGKTIAREPATFLLSCVYRAGWLWAAWPNFDHLSSAVVGIGLWYLAWYCGAVVALFRAPRRMLTLAWWPGLALVVALTCVHAVFWGNMRMRGQAMPVVYLAATSCLLPLRRQPARNDSMDSVSQPQGDGAETHSRQANTG